jgi:hypothetical protein
MVNTMVTFWVNRKAITGSGSSIYITGTKANLFDFSVRDTRKSETEEEIDYLCVRDPDESESEGILFSRSRMVVPFGMFVFMSIYLYTMSSRRCSTYTGAREACRLTRGLSIQRTLWYYDDRTSSIPLTLLPPPYYYSLSTRLLGCVLLLLL